MRNCILGIIFFWLGGQAAFAQPVEASLMSGPGKTDFQTFMVRNLDEDGTFSFTSLAFFQRYHRTRDRAFDELGVQGTVFWNINRNVGIGPGIYYNSPKGLMARGVVQYVKKTGPLTLLANPALYYHEGGFWGAELFGRLAYSRPVSDRWSIIARTDFLTTWDRFADHGRSFLQLRIGPGFEPGLFIGIAYDHDRYGPPKIARNSFGLFIEHRF